MIILIEGIEGSGKSVFANKLKEAGVMVLKMFDRNAEKGLISIKQFLNCRKADNGLGIFTNAPDGHTEQAMLLEMLRQIHEQVGAHTPCYALDRTMITTTVYGRVFKEYSLNEEVTNWWWQMLYTIPHLLVHFQSTYEMYLAHQRAKIGMQNRLMPLSQWTEMQKEFESEIFARYQKPKLVLVKSSSTQQLMHNVDLAALSVLQEVVMQNCLTRFEKKLEA